MKNFWVFLILGFLIIFLTKEAFAEQIPITWSDSMNKIVFDGKWTNMTEWKKSSLNEYLYKNNTEYMVLRSAHQDNFVYILIDFVSDTTPEKGDTATICFDTKNDKSKLPNDDDYCIISSLEEKSIVMQGDSSISEGGFKQITSPKELISTSSPSDKEDRYSRIPHSSYEFRIPTDLITRSNIYGFYAGVYDSKQNYTYTIPPNIKLNNTKQIPSPSLWTEIVSPDKSLPEFHLPMIMMLTGLVVVIYFSKKKIKQ